jgi:hypothetical protein
MAAFWGYLLRNPALMQSHDQEFAEFLCLLGLIPISVYGLGSLRKFISYKPSLQFDTQGIWDNRSDFSVGLIAWKDVDHLDFVSVEKSNLIRVYLKDKKLFAGTIPAWKRLWLAHPIEIDCNSMNLPISWNDFGTIISGLEATGHTKV